MSKYKHVFFDLDHTLWDFDRNSEETLHELYHKYNLSQYGITSPALFNEAYRKRNLLMWEQFRLGEITKAALRADRFAYVFSDLSIDATLVPVGMSEDYVQLCPQKGHLTAGTRETLEYLKGNYHLHIISNGFADIQDIKLRTSGVHSYFTHIITAEKANANKPDKAIFDFARNLCGAEFNSSIMIGDELHTDIAGARNVGMDQVYYNPAKAAHNHNVRYEISHMAELQEIL